MEEGQSFLAEEIQVINVEPERKSPVESYGRQEPLVRVGIFKGDTGYLHSLEASLQKYWSVTVVVSAHLNNLSLGGGVQFLSP